MTTHADYSIAAIAIHQRRNFVICKKFHHPELEQLASQRFHSRFHSRIVRPWHSRMITSPFYSISQLLWSSRIWRSHSSLHKTGLMWRSWIQPNANSVTVQPLWFMTLRISDDLGLLNATERQLPTSVDNVPSTPRQFEMQNQRHWALRNHQDLHLSPRGEEWINTLF